MDLNIKGISVGVQIPSNLRYNLINLTLSLINGEVNDQANLLMKYRPLHSFTCFLIIVAEWYMSMNLDTQNNARLKNNTVYQSVYNVIKVKCHLSYYFQKQVNML